MEFVFHFQALDIGYACDVIVTSSSIGEGWDLMVPVQVRIYHIGFILDRLLENLTLQAILLSK